MPRKIDESITYETKNGRILYKSSKEISKTYDKEKVDNIRLRLPKGYNDKMKEYVKSSDKYSSVNDMIRKLVEAELGLTDE